MKLISCDLFDRHDHRSSSGARQDGILPHIFAVLGVVSVVDTKAKI